MQWRVLISSYHMQQALPQYEKLLVENNVEVLFSPNNSQYLIESEMLAIVDDTIDGIICSDDHITRRVMEKAKKLKVISKWGTGIDSIDQIAAKEFGIRICNSPGAFSHSVSDMVICYILCFARQPYQTDQSVRQEKWTKFSGRSLESLTLGIIGVGNIGQTLALKAKALGMRVLGNDIKKIEEQFIQKMGIRMVDLTTLLQNSDVVSVNCDYNSTSHHLLGQRELALMKPTAILINTARGPVIHQEELIKVLQSNSIAGAALDVFEEEPLPHPSELRQLDNVLLAPHNSYNTRESSEFVHKNTLTNLINCLKESGA